jgi:hypothetical protein
VLTIVEDTAGWSSWQHPRVRKIVVVESGGPR